MIASTSSVYGANTEMPFRETDRADHPLTLYAASKKAGEDMAHAYAHLYRIPTTAFRFFTVYGPWGRPDMALFKFVAATLKGEPIEVYGEGQMRRDFTYIDDLVEAVTRLIDAPPRQGEPVGAAIRFPPPRPIAWSTSAAGKRSGSWTSSTPSSALWGRASRRRMLPMQKGDVPATWASPDLLRALTGYVPSTAIETGVRRFVEWRRQRWRGAHAVRAHRCARRGSTARTRSTRGAAPASAAGARPGNRELVDQREQLGGLLVQRSRRRRRLFRHRGVLLGERSI